MKLLRSCCFFFFFLSFSFEWTEFLFILGIYIYIYIFESTSVWTILIYSKRPWQHPLTWTIIFTTASPIKIRKPQRKAKANLLYLELLWVPLYNGLNMNSILQANFLTNSTKVLCNFVIKWNVIATTALYFWFSKFHVNNNCLTIQFPP